MNKIGVLGGGQLGRMLALAGYPLGMQFAFFVDQPSSAVEELGKKFLGESNFSAFLQNCEVITFESENTDLALAEAISTSHQFYPGINSLKYSQNRQLEKNLFNELSIPTASYRIVSCAAEISEAIKDFGLPVVAKTLTQGYDGKGQFIIRTPDDISTCWQTLRQSQLLIEAFVEFEMEVSQIAVRDKNQQILFYPLTFNFHEQGILRFSLAYESSNYRQLVQSAQIYTKKLMGKLDHVGVFTLEFFVKNNKLLANEMAPRVHNSGHWTMNGAVTSQFENHLRAITGLPLGATEFIQPINLMINHIGEIPPHATLLNIPSLHLHDYAKLAKAGRKLGHSTITVKSKEDLLKKINQLSAHITKNTQEGLEKLIHTMEFK